MATHNMPKKKKKNVAYRHRWALGYWPVNPIKCPYLLVAATTLEYH